MSAVTTKERKIQRCREKALDWLEGMRLPLAGQSHVQVFRSSRFHHPDRWPQMLYPASYNAVHALRLLGFESETLRNYSLASFLQQQQGGDGFFKMVGVDYLHGLCKESKPEDRGYVREYFDFHVSNYALSALSLMEEQPCRPLTFLDDYDSQEKLDRWWQHRYWQDPWAEGNFIVNLASFYQWQAEEKGDPVMEQLFAGLLKYNERSQDQRSGYWTQGFPRLGKEALEVGMAGAAHNFHLYFARNQAIRCYEKIIDHCLAYLQHPCRSACLDVDAVDILCNMFVYNYRRSEILETADSFLDRLLDWQNPDGGFPDTRQGVRRFDSWICGYWEPQGWSNVFASWFRLIAIAMLSWLLGYNGDWNFRRLVGIGYFNPHYRP